MNEQKDILVTGCCGGMGSAICKKLIEQNYRVFGIDKSITSKNSENFFQFECDVTSIESIKNTFNKIKEKTNSLFAIIHTSGIYDLDSLIEIDEERFNKIFQVNLFGVYRINKEFFPLLKNKSRIVITTSELAPLDPLPFTGLYGITKTALEKYAFSLRMELQLLGIKVVVIRPGAVKTTLLNTSTTALDKFIENTKNYSCNAIRFKKIVDSVEAKNILPEKIAQKVLISISCKKPKFIYNINRNPLLRLLNFLPAKLQVAIIGLILKK
mgnify:FL=1